MTYEISKEIKNIEAICDLSTGYIVWQGDDGGIWGETYGGSSVVRRCRMENYSDLVG